MSKNELLDIEDDESRRQRLGKLFADFSESKSASPTGPELPNPESASRPFAIPESDVLARVRAFLPGFQSSTNDILAQAAADPDAVNLERVKKGEGAVSMDLGLGVYDAPGLKGREEQGGAGLGPVVDSSGEVPVNDDDSDSESSEDEEVETSSEEETSEDDGEDTEGMASTGHGTP